MTNSLIAYRGPSLLGPGNIALIVTGLGRSSSNRKTGSMIQTYIVQDTFDSPVFHVKQHTDASICGDCKFAGGQGCYVNVGQAPYRVHETLRAGRYHQADPLEIALLAAGRTLRLGSYGDPAAVPPGILRTLITFTKSHTGYTHQWARRPDLADILMASVDSPDERIQAQLLGFRTFRVAPRSGTLWSDAHRPGSHEILCPASIEAGHLTTCDQCGLCSGARAGGVKDIMIPAHGATAGRAEHRMQA